MPLVRALAGDRPLLFGYPGLDLYPVQSLVYPADIDELRLGLRLLLGLLFWGVATTIGP